MSGAFKCDTCGDFFEPGHCGESVYVGARYRSPLLAGARVRLVPLNFGTETNRHEVLDLCPICAGALQEAFACPVNDP